MARSVDGVGAAARGMGRQKKMAGFFDCDGDWNSDPGYLNRVDDFQFFLGVKKGLKLLADHGMELFVVSNQSGIGRGLIKKRELEQIHRRMIGELQEEGITLAGVYICPHSPADGCSCRKPSPEMILKAAKKYRLDLPSSYVVGDKWTDVQMGIRAGVKTILVGNAPRPDGETRTADHVAKDLFCAAQWIIKSKEKN